MSHYAYFIHNRKIVHKESFAQLFHNLIPKVIHNRCKVFPHIYHARGRVRACDRTTYPQLFPPCGKPVDWHGWHVVCRVVGTARRMAGRSTQCHTAHRSLA